MAKDRPQAGDGPRLRKDGQLDMRYGPRPSTLLRWTNEAYEDLVWREGLGASSPPPDEPD